MAGKLYYSDNLFVLRDSVPDDSIDLIYLDPPFNSNATYNVLFKAPSGRQADSQLQAFEDTWSWGEEAEAAYAQVLRSSSPVAGILRALRSFLGQNDMMAYLAMMTVRLTHLRRVLKDSGSLYLHCDPTASHYLKVILDGIFGAANFRNEIVWQRSAPKGHAHRRFASSHDILLFYAKGDQPKWRPQHLPHREEYVASHYANVEDGSGRRYMLDNCLNPNPDRPNLTYDWNGHHRVWRWTKDKMQDLHDSGRIAYTKTGMPRYKRYLDEMSGTPVSSVWTDIPPVNSQAKERLGYATQKPLALLERIIRSTTDEGDVVLDPFCGCGTAIHAAERLGRHWVGIDVTHLAIQVIEDRLRYYFPALSVPVIGRPTDLEGARDLAARDKYQFQWWATWLVGGAPRGGRKKGADHGVDGDLYFMTDRDRDAHAVISVKGGQRLGPAFVRDLRGVREREGADLALLICLEEPTEEMRREAASGGFFETASLQLPRIQILTVADLLTSGAGIRAPTYDTVTAAQAARRRKTAKPPRRPSPDQRELLLPLPARPDGDTVTGLSEPTASTYAAPTLLLPPFLRARLKIAV